MNMRVEPSDETMKMFSTVTAVFPIFLTYISQLALSLRRFTISITILSVAVLLVEPQKFLDSETNPVDQRKIGMKRAETMLNNMRLAKIGERALRFKTDFKAYSPIINKKEGY